MSGVEVDGRRDFLSPDWHWQSLVLPFGISGLEGSPCPMVLAALIAVPDLSWLNFVGIAPSISSHHP